MLHPHREPLEKAARLMLDVSESINRHLHNYELKLINLVQHLGAGSGQEWSMLLAPYRQLQKISMAVATLPAHCPYMQAAGSAALGSPHSRRSFSVRTQSIHAHRSMDPGEVRVYVLNDLLLICKYFARSDRQIPWALERLEEVGLAADDNMLVLRLPGMRGAEEAKAEEPETAETSEVSQEASSGSAAGAPPAGERPPPKQEVRCAAGRQGRGRGRSWPARQPASLACAAS